MEESKRIPRRPPSGFPIPLRGRRSDLIIRWLRHNKFVIFLYTWLTDTLVPFVLAVVIVMPVGAVLLLFYIPKFFRNWQRRRRYGVEVIPWTWPSE
jgi:hypothetical protein